MSASAANIRSTTKSLPREVNHREHDPRRYPLSDSQTTHLYGYCHCGCGNETDGVYPKTASDRGQVKGEPKRFLPGHANIVRSRPAEERFWEKVDQDGPNGCWIWTGTKNEQGYGRFALFCRPTRQVRAYRYSYELLVGPIPEGLELDHLCRNRGCVNPDHLEPVTHRENTLRGFNPAGMNARKTHCIHGHEFTEKNTIHTKRGGRHCRACKNRDAREYRRRQRVA